MPPLLDTTLVPDSLVFAMEVFLLVAKEVAGAMEVLAAAMLGGKNWGCPNPVISGGRNTPPAPVAMELVAVETVGRDVAVVMRSPVPSGLLSCDSQVLGRTGALILAVAIVPGGRAMLPARKNNTTFVSTERLCKTRLLSVTTYLPVYLSLSTYLSISNPLSLAT